jgi:hypothetical protein
MRGEDDDAELEVRMLLELAERPVEVAVVGARGGDDGDAAGHWTGSAAAASSCCRMTSLGWYSGTRSLEASSQPVRSRVEVARSRRLEG